MCGDRYCPNYIPAISIKQRLKLALFHLTQNFNFFCKYDLATQVANGLNVVLIYPHSSGGKIKLERESETSLLTPLCLVPLV